MIKINYEYESRGDNDDDNINIRFKTTIIRSSLCSYSDAYIIVKETITVPNTAAAGAAVNNTNKKVVFKNCAPFTRVQCIRLSGQFQVCLFVFYEKNFERKKSTKCKTNEFPPLRSFCACKNCFLCCFLYASFCFVSWFLFVTCFCAFNIFSLKKKLNRLETVLTCTPIDHPIENYFFTY